MKNKKLISVLISIILVISLTASVFIATANAKEVSITITTDKQEIKTGETATISVSATTNFPVATMSIPVFYDKTLVDVESCETPLDYAYATSTTDKTAVDFAKIYANTGIESEKFGFVLATYIAGAGDTVDETLTDEVVLTFTITAKADVSGSAIFEIVSESAKTEDNIKGMLYFGAQPEGNVIDKIPENVENIDVSTATVNISDGKNALTLNENAPFEAIIDLDNNLGGEYTGTIYGFDTLGWNEDWTADGTIADFFTTAYGDDYLEVVVGDAGVETTGTIVNVLDEDGNVVESYMFIYFGDMDGDGAVGLADSAMAEDYEMLFEGIDTLNTFMAGDLDADSMPGLSDSALMFDWEMLAEGMPYQADVAVNIYGNIIYEIF